MSGRMRNGYAILLLVVAACTNSNPAAEPTPISTSARVAAHALISVETRGGGPARLGSTVELRGNGLRGASHVRFSNARLSAPIDVTVSGATDTYVRVHIPSGSAAKRWIAGRYQVLVEIPLKSGVAQTNTLPFSLSPTIISPMPMRVGIRNYYTTATATVRLRVAPNVLPSQVVALVIAGRPVPAFLRSGATSDLRFTVSMIQTGTYAVRLRVDGVDSEVTTKSPDMSQTITFYVSSR